MSWEGPQVIWNGHLCIVSKDRSSSWLLSSTFVPLPQIVSSWSLVNYSHSSHGNPENRVIRTWDMNGYDMLWCEGPATTTCACSWTVWSYLVAKCVVSFTKLGVVKREQVTSSVCWTQHVCLSSSLSSVRMSHTFVTQKGFFLLWWTCTARPTNSLLSGNKAKTFLSNHQCTTCSHVYMLLIAVI